MYGPFEDAVFVGHDTGAFGAQVRVVIYTVKEVGHARLFLYGAKESSHNVLCGIG